MSLNPPHGTVGKYIIPANFIPVEHLKRLINVTYKEHFNTYVLTYDSAKNAAVNFNALVGSLVRVYEPSLSAIQTELVRYLDLRRVGRVIGRTAGEFCRKL
jgi:hypothetical protein